MKINVKAVNKFGKNRYFYIGLFVLVFGVIFNFLSTIYVSTIKENLVPLQDTLLDAIPSIGSFYYFYNVVAILIILTFLIFIISKKKYVELPYFMLIIGIFYIVRGLFIALTPFGNPEISYERFLNQLDILRFGLYPSGHTGLAFLMGLFTEGVYRKVMLGGVCFLAMGLLLAHGHYSMDIFGAVIFAYAIYSFGEIHLKKFKGLD
jgi:hypothetical protein